MVSVCMATYNGGRFLREQIDSILCQLGEGDELIISDDGSTDDTIDIIKSYADDRIKLLHHQKDPSIAKRRFSRNFYYATQNFENALKQAKGDYIFLSDQDDVWLEGRVEKEVEALQHCACVICNYNLIDGNGNVVKARFYEENPLKSKSKVMLRLPFMGCTMAVTSDFLSRYCLPFPKDSLQHDTFMGLMAYSNKLIHYEPEVLHSYRSHAENLSPTATGNSSNPLWYKLSYRLKLYKDVAERNRAVKKG